MADEETGSVLPEPEGEPVSPNADEEELLPLTDAELQSLEESASAEPDASEP